MSELEQLEQAITALETQRAVLGDAVVEAALAPMREKLASLQMQPVTEQRKLLTVLFADLAGFTAMSEKMDPEDVREVMNAYFGCWTTCIQQHGGFVEKFIGDAVMAIFGLPLVREDDPESAIRAALDMRQALETLNEDLERTWGLKLAMRVGIHTGPVVVTLKGERNHQDFVVVGDTVNVASRLQAAAPVGGILISHDTYRHVRGIFSIQKLNPIRAKGKREPIQVYLVQRAKPRAFRETTRGVEGIETKMVGREAELKKLQDALLGAIEGNELQIVTVVGDAGLGKSRLIYEFDNWLEIMPEVVLYFKGRAGASRQNIAYSLLRDLFSFRFQIQDSDSQAMVREQDGLLNRAGHPSTSEVLEALRVREMVYQRDESAFETTHEYLFKHALLRDVTYESVLKRYRRIYHAHAARWLEQVTQRSQRGDDSLGGTPYKNPLNGTAEPWRVYVCCHRVLAASGDARALPVLNAAYALLEENASRISDPDLRRSFLENVPGPRELQAIREDFEREKAGIG